MISSKTPSQKQSISSLQTESSKQSNGGEVAFVSLNRKKTKIEYLSQENIQLREQVEELQNIIHLNKEALKIAMQTPLTTHPIDGLSGATTSHFPISENSFSKGRGNLNGPLIGTSQDNPKALNFVLQALYQENESLVKINKRLTDERNIAQGKALINEQISEASQKHEKELTSGLEEKVLSLSQKVKEQEQIIYTYEKTRPNYDEVSGIVIKYRDVININDQTLRLHDENERLNMIILKQAKELDSLRSYKSELVKINMIVKLQSNQISVFNKPSKEAIGAKELIKKIVSNLTVHMKLMKEGNESDEDDYEGEVEEELEAEASPLPDKAQLNTNLHTEGATNSFIKAPAISIPKLDLAKAFQIQEMNAKKSTIQFLQKQQGSDIGAVCQQLKKVEIELTIARKNLQREMLMNKTLQIENQNFKRINKELEAINETLVSSQAGYDTRWAYIFKAFQFYKEHYQKAKPENVNGNIQDSQMFKETHALELTVSQLNCVNVTKQYSNKKNNETNANRQNATIIPTNNDNFNMTQSQFNMMTQESQFIGADPDKFTASRVQSTKNVDSKGFHFIQPITSLIEMNLKDLNIEQDLLKFDPFQQREYTKACLQSVAKDVYALFTKIKEKYPLKMQKSKSKSGSRKVLRSHSLQSLNQNVKEVEEAVNLDKSAFVKLNE